jgi:hypothetical protein
VSQLSPFGAFFSTTFSKIFSKTHTFPGSIRAHPTHYEKEAQNGKRQLKEALGHASFPANPRWCRQSTRKVKESAWPNMEDT